MTEHPMITACNEAYYAHISKTTARPIPTAVIAALQWLADPSNLSDDVVETVVKEVDVSVGLILPCKVKATITALANALLKEIEE